MKRHPLLAFFALTFLFSWGLWFVMLRIDQGAWQVSNRKETVMQLWKWGGFSPFFVALLVAFGAGGMNGIQNLLNRFLIWRVGIQWFLIALFLPCAISLLITAIHMMFGGDAPDFSFPKIYAVNLTGFYQDYTALSILIPIFLQNLLIGSPVDSTPIGEETGWRGFALPHLQGRFNALASSVILGLIWGLWRLPLFWMQGSEASVGAYALILLGVIPGAVLATWIFNNTGGSLLLVLLYNNSIKMTDWFVALPHNLSPWVPIAVFWLVAGAVVLWTRPARFSRRPLDPRCIEGIEPNRIPVVQNLPPPAGA